MDLDVCSEGEVKKRMVVCTRLIKSLHQQAHVLKPDTKVLPAGLKSSSCTRTAGGAGFGSDLTADQPDRPWRGGMGPRRGVTPAQVVLRLNLADVRPNRQIMKKTLIFFIADPLSPSLVLICNTIHFSISDHLQAVITTEQQCFILHSTTQSDETLRRR